MNKEEVSLLLSEGEGYKVEFKENISKLDKEIVAFANSSGGLILVGIDDTGIIKGVNVTNALKSQVQDIANNCEPKADILMESCDNILVIKVLEGGDKPYKCSSGFYKRIGPNSQKLSRDEIISLFKSEGRSKFDEMINSKFNYPDDFDMDKYKNFIGLAGLSESVDIEKSLVSLGVAEKQDGRLSFNNAGVMFFAKDPQEFVPWSAYTVVLFKDKEGIEIIDRKDIRGSLFEIVEEVIKFVRLYAKVAYRFTGNPQRENIYEYPFEALREAVINSVMHKYYFEHGHNDILRFFPDSIKIENYWLEPDNFVLGKTVFRRNQVIADLFSRIHFGERLGTGFERIREACMKEKAPYPEIEFNGNYFWISFRQSKAYLDSAKSKGVEKVPEKVPENQRIIIKEVSKNPNVTSRQLSAIIGISERKVKENMKKLKEKGMLERIGPDKGGYWKVLQKQK